MSKRQTTAAGIIRAWRCPLPPNPLDQRWCRASDILVASIQRQRLNVLGAARLIPENRVAHTAAASLKMCDIRRLKMIVVQNNVGGDPSD
jgi:hypothetical protein